MKTTAVVLAAGLSSRMGVHKPLLPVGGIPAVRRTVNAVLDSGSGVVIVTGHRSGDIYAALDGLDVNIVYNEAYETGMFSSVLRGLRAVPAGTEAFFLLPADCCAISSETMRFLSGFANGAEIVYPVYNGKRGHPPLIPARHISGLLAYEGHGGAREFLKEQPSRTVEVNDPGILLDMDTPDDYAALLRCLNIPGYPENPYELARTLHVSDEIIEHGRQVAKICAVIADKTARNGLTADTALLSSSAILHDIARAGDNHAEQGAEILLRHGYPEAAKLVRTHMEPPPENASLETKILYLADKLCRRGEIVMPNEQLARMKTRFADNPEAAAGAEKRLLRCVELLKELDLNASDFI